MELQQHIFLLGMPGSGKTTLGRALQARGYDFVDLDEQIERTVSMSIADYVSANGMEAFRRIESEILRRLVEASPMVIATGGGTACQERNMNLMLRGGLTVKLTCERRRHIKRLMDAGATRPMLATIYTDKEAVNAFIGKLEAIRAPWYDRAAVCFDASMLESEQEIQSTTDQFIKLISAL